MADRLFLCTLWTSLLPLLVVSSIHHYRLENFDLRIPHVQPKGVRPTGLFPRIFNLAKHANISANGTCGFRQPEVYCRRPSDKEARRANQCVPTLCDVKKNGIRKAVDGSKDSWISPTLENGLEYEYITITLDLKQVYQVAYVTIKAGIAPLPAAWILEKSLDGTNFTPWQYFAESDAKCLKRYGLRATQAKPHYKTDDEVICLINYSKLYYADNEEVHVSLLNGRPGLASSSETLKNFTVARYVRLRLQKINKTEKDLILRKKLFYSIRTIIIGGQCLCNGHASKCVPSKSTGLPTCECEHNTCGKHCDECCPTYNQVPWSPGTFDSASECERCECHGHSEQCVYDSQIAEAKLSLDINGYYRGGGHCLNCRNHTAGVNCEKCEKGWYRPTGIHPDDPSPCVPCDCHPVGSTEACIQDDDLSSGKLVGSCECKEGYAGTKCDECAPGRRNFPACELCPCDVRGSVPDDTCTVPCTCKANVEGKYCEKCLPGFFGLSQENPDGCVKCYCSGVSDICNEYNQTLDVINSPLNGEWKIADLSASKTIAPVEDPEMNALFIGNYELPGIESYYWLAPSSLCGSQVGMYGKMALTFTVGWEAMRGDTSGQPTIGPNLILVGDNGVRLGYGEDIFIGRKGNITLSVVLVEDGWYTILPEVKDIRTRLRRTEYRGVTITREQFLGVLANLTHIMMRAKFHTDQVEGSLLSVKLEPKKREVGDRIHLPEKCSCPSEFGGLSCETCAFGHFKSQEATFDAQLQCTPCPCNGHSECDPGANICKKCEHHTIGDHCEQCMDGYYGDAQMGTPEDCKRCACPLEIPSNNFSPKCELLNDYNETTDQRPYYCSECPIGYIGDYCEECDEFYYGNPSEIGGSCQPCNCSGASCDPITGECLTCLDNMEGILCDRCKALHYKSPNSTGCIRCDCNIGGSLNDTCDVDTGQCECKPEYRGRECGECVEGYGYAEGGCEKCECGLAAKNDSCDPKNGICNCEPGARPPKCTDCLPDHYGFSELGCTGCGCHALGSDHTFCDVDTGQCKCKSNVTGRACDQCLSRHWGINSGRGCRTCDCHPLGALSPSCDVETGQCVCKSGVGGLKCDKCLVNHYGFSINGCAKCQECNVPGHVCDPETGRCVCPPHTQGVHCQTCTPNAWGYQALEGCTPCHCDSGGSTKSQCDFVTGKCTCRKGFRGNRCNECDHGYYNFPFCKACDCEYAGTANDTCNPETRTCHCDDFGSCRCKPNVVGKKCDICRNGTFGIQADNPNGCTACFCFGRSALCTQAGLHWSQIRAGRTRTVIIEHDPSSPYKNTLPIDSQQICYIHLAMPDEKEVVINGADRGLNVTNDLRTLPGDTEDVKIGVSFFIDTPVYWKLPKQFLGDKVLSYGGYLKFLVETEGGNKSFPSSILFTYPLVQLQGNSKIVLQHFPLLPNKMGRYEVRFHESLWQDKYHPDKKVSRETLMVALQNVQHILIRASESADFNKAVSVIFKLRDVSLDTAAASNGVNMADGVELCECPPEYNSSSCQDPSIGFYRWYDKDVNTATILIQLVGEARPCECNNRSDTCDIETGFCQNCMNNTGGPYCERCDEGYYGDPFVEPCMSCPCPEPERNFAVSCRVQPGRETVCQCKPGYTGKQCDRCAYGWFGYPEESGGFCQPCKCNVYGSVSDECDEKTGQCNCQPGIEGRDCSICPDRMVLKSTGCSTCEDECTGILMMDFQNLTLSVETAVRSNLKIIKPPWKSLEELERKLLAASKNMTNWKNTMKTIEQFLEGKVVHDFKMKGKNLFQKVQDIDNRAKSAKSEAAFVRKEIEYLMEKIKDVHEDVEKTIQNLKIYSGKREQGVSDAIALKEANLILKGMKELHLEPKKEQVDQILDFCTGVLNQTMHMTERFPEILDMKEQLKLLRIKLDNMEGLVKRVIDSSQKRLIQVTDNRNRIMHLKKKIGRFLGELEKVDEIRGEADSLLYDADLYLNEVDENNKNLTGLRDRLKNATDELQKKAGILENLNSLYKNKYVKPAQMHATVLMEKAQELKDLFKETKQDTNLALIASKRYEDIIFDLEAAKKAAKEAVDSELMYKIFPPKFDEGILNRSDVLKALSTSLKERGTQQGEKNMELRNKLEEVKDIVDNVEDTVRETAIKDNQISEDLYAMQNDSIGEKVRQSVDKMEQLEKNLKEAKDNVEKFKMEVLYDLKRKMGNLDDQNGGFTMEKAKKKVQDSLNINKINLALLNKLNRTNEEAGTRSSASILSSKLNELKNKITEAMHSAESIRLSLSSNSTKGCVRSFKISGLQPSTTGRLMVSLTVDPLQSNRIIFFLPSSITNDFMALEMVDGNIRFVWNNGGGPGVVSKSLIQSTKKIGPQWFKIIAERISHTAKLWVYTEDSKDQDPAKNSSDPNYGRLDVGPNDRVWVGGLPQNYDRPGEILSLQQGLPGCLHSLAFNDRPIGLWNYYTDSTDSCSACEKGADDAVESTSYSFNGRGYSQLKQAPKTIYNRYQFSVALKFKTYDDNSILFLAISADKSRYASLTLRDGRVVFQIGYGEESQLEMSSTRRYNDGNWTTVEASRNFDRRRIIEKGLLRVEDEMKEAAPPTPPMQSQIPELATADYLVGGCPPSYDFGSLSLRLPKPFLGCLSDIVIEKDIYNPLKGKSNGVGTSCVDNTLNTAGFHGRGYLKLEATRLKKDSSFGLALRTLQSNALVLLANGMIQKISDFENEISNDIEPKLLQEEKRKENYYSVSLVEGRIEVRINAGNGVITLVSQKFCNDGRFHSISVTKSGRKLELRVDDELQSSSALPGGAIVVKAKDLYLGGVPDTIDASVYASDTTPFVGTIKDLLFNHMLYSFDNPLFFTGVDIGRFGPENVENMTLTDIAEKSPQPQNHFQCYRSRKYSLDPRAAKLGDTIGSFIQINLRRRGTFQKSYSIQLDFRTFHPDGLLFFIPGTNKSGKQKNFLLCLLSNGRLEVVLKSKKKLSVTSESKLNNGTWHTILITRVERKLTAAINKAEVMRLRLPKKVNLSHTFYVGGRSEQGITDPLVSKTSAFNGCVKNLKINNQTEDLIGEKSQHHGVGQCFPHIERGSYFSGDAFVAYKKDLALESLLKIELEFRTSEMSGILLSFSDFISQPAMSLEINNGKIIFMIDFDTDVKFRLVHEFVSEFVVCDNKWHRIHIMIDSNELTMRVDQSDVKQRFQTGDYLDRIVSAPVYIGGLPELITGGKPILETRDNFKGCMRNIVLGDDNIDFTKINIRQNVLIGSCPANNNH